MAMPTEDNERSIIDENTGLLSNACTTTISNDGSESQLLDGASSMRPVLTSLLLIYLFQAGISASVAPTTDIIEGIICRNYYRNHEGTAGHSACKAEPIQSKLAALKGMSSLLTPLPGIILVVPYSLLANKYGILRILLWSIMGVLLADTWYALVCWQDDAWPYRLIWLSPTFYLIGGGPAVFITLLLNFIANVSPIQLRASRFFQLEAAGYLGNISGYFVGSTLSTYGPWLPVSIGIAFEVIVVLLLVGSLATIPVAVYSNPVDPPKSPATLRNENTDPPPPLVKGFKQKYAALWQFLKAEKALVTILFGYFLRMLGVSVSRIFLLYVSKRFDWSFSKSAYFLTLDSIVHLTVLLILPFVNNILLTTLSLSSLRKDIWLTRSSNIFSMIGSLGLALSYSPTLMVISVIVYGLGAGYNSSTRGLLTTLTSPEHRALLFSVMSMLDIAGTMIGAPLWPAIFVAGLRFAGSWVGLPFIVASALLFVVSLTIEMSHFVVTW